MSRPSTSATPNADAMWRAILYIQNHLEEPFTLEDVAAVAHYSPYHFHRMFKAFTGEPFKAYVRRLRLESSAFALRTSNDSVAELAFSSGFFTHESFSRAFRRAFGENPQAYRNVRTVPVSASDRYLNDVGLVHFPGRTCAFRRCLGPYETSGLPESDGSPWRTLARELSEPLECLELYGISRDDPEITACERIRYDACVAVPEGFDAGHAATVELPRGHYVRGTHVGPFDALTASYHYLIYTWTVLYRKSINKNVPPFERFVMDRLPDGLATTAVQILVPLRSQ